MHLFSSGVKISGPDVRIMLECWLHAVTNMRFKP